MLDTKEAQRVLGEWREKKGKATGGPWGAENNEVYSASVKPWTLVDCHHVCILGDENTDFIIHARNTPIEDHLEAALDEVERLKGILEAKRQDEMDAFNARQVVGVSNATKLISDADYGGIGRVPRCTEAGQRLWDEASDKEEP